VVRGRVAEVDEEGMGACVSWRLTVAELQDSVKSLEPYREAFWAYRRGEKPVVFCSTGGAFFFC